jgi:hypothetical protein
MHDESGEEFDLEIDWELSLETLVMLHYLNGRAWDINGTLKVPSRVEIEAKVMEMIEAIRDLGGGIYLTLNGFKVYSDPEFIPGSYEIYIKAGHASPRIPEGSK